MSDPAVLIVMPLAELRGGAETALLQLIEKGRSIRWHVAFLEDGPMVEQARRAGAQVSVIPAGRARQLHKYAAAVLTLSRLAKRIQARAMLAWMAKAHLYCGPAARLAGVPAVWFQHGMPTDHGIFHILAARIRAAGSLACSEFVAGAQRKMMPKVPVRVVYPAADLERFDPDALPSPPACRQELGLGGDGPLIGTFGRLQTFKGVHVLIDAMPQIISRYPSGRLLIVGGTWPLEPDYPLRLRRQIEGLGLSGKVIFAGHQDQVAQWMQACDIVVHAAHEEPFGMVVVEAMALGKPVVASASGGPREIITTGVDGLLVPPGNTGELAAAVLRFLDDRALAARIASAAVQRARHFSVQRYADSLCAALCDWMSPVADSRGLAQVHAP